jgi:hypothetical protein
MCGDRPLARHGCCRGIYGSTEDKEEAIPSRVDLVAPMGGDRRTQQLPVLLQQDGIAVAALLEEPRAALYVTEQ